MRQHPIPQNVLDVEFKLFTKFTLKEFAYLVAGILGGSIFLFLNRQIGFPGIIAWPSFLFLSGVGAFFALVPINGQNADEFVKNYFVAINKPTQRVWLNKKMKQERIKPVLDNDLQKKKKIVGGDIEENKPEFDEKPGDDIFGEVDIPGSSSTRIDEVNTHEENGTQLTIGSQNALQYQIEIQSVNKLPGNINAWVIDSNNRSIANLPVFLKNTDGKIIYANKTGPNGYFLTNTQYPPGLYFIEFDQNNYHFPTIKLVVDKEWNKNPIKIIGQTKV